LTPRGTGGEKGGLARKGGKDLTINISSLLEGPVHDTAG